MGRMGWRVVAVASLVGVATAAVCAATQEPDLKDRVRKAVDRGTTYLKSKQQNGNWETVGSFLKDQAGGVSALAVSALLEAGGRPQDPALKAGLEYLKSVKSEGTYVVAWQTMAFCKADPAAYRDEIARNVARFKSTARRNEAKELQGWGYGFGLLGVDHTNTYFAVEALHAAAHAGHDIEPSLWREIHGIWTRNQLQRGGWGYPTRNPHSERLTMTAAGVTCLAICARYLKPEEIEAEPLRRGLDRVGGHP